MEAASDQRADESTLPVSLPISSPALSVDAIALDVGVGGGSGNEVVPIVDDNDNSNVIRDLTADKNEEFVPDTPTSCNSINTIQVGDVGWVAGEWVEFRERGSGEELIC